jgi:hypothetical protein
MFSKGQKKSTYFFWWTSSKWWEICLKMDSDQKRMRRQDGHLLPLELVNEQRGSFGSSLLVSNGVLNFDFFKDRSIIEFNQEGISNGSLGGIMVINAEAFVFNAEDFGPQCIDTRVSSRIVVATWQRSDSAHRLKHSNKKKNLLAFRGKFTEDKGIGNHVVNGMAGEGGISTCLANMSYITHSRSAKLSSGPCLSMILLAAS